MKHKKIKNIIIFFFICSFLQSCEVESKYYNQKVKQQIISLKSDKSIKGSFILGSGSIKEVDYYYFFIKDTVFNGYKKHKIPSLQTLIVEKDTIPTFFKNQILKVTTKKYLFRNLEEVEKEYSDYGIEQLFTGIEIPKHIKYKYILFVPKGVVTKNIKWEAL